MADFNQVSAAETQQESTNTLIGGASSAGATVTTAKPIDQTGTQQSEVKAPISSNVRNIILSSRNKRMRTLECDAFLDTMKLHLKEQNIDFVESPLEGTYFAVKDDLATCLVIDETQTHVGGGSVPYQPTASIVSEIREDPICKQQLESLGAVCPENVLVHPTDYTSPVMTGENAIRYAQSRAVIMGNVIRNSLNTSVNADITINDLQNYPLRIITNPVEVRRHLENNCPHGILPYYQVGCVVEICLDQKAYGDKNFSKFDRNSRNWEFLFMLGIHTEIMEQMSSNPTAKRNQPVINLTAFESVIRSPKMLPFMLGVAHEVFIKQGLWQTAFSSTNPDVQPNLGYLYFSVEDKLPTPFRDQQELSTALLQDFEPPLFTIDIQGGRFVHPAFSQLLEAKSRLLLQQELCEMDPSAHDLLTNPEPIFSTIPIYTGFVRDNGELIDSRAIDYFRVIKNHPANPSLCRQFRQYFMNVPEWRLRSIEEAGWNNGAGATRVLESVYNTSKIILNGSTMNKMLAFAAKLKFFNNMRQNNMPMLTDGLLDHARLMANGNASLYQNSFTGFATTNNGYGWDAIANNFIRR